jgi:hypothetical protein
MLILQVGIHLSYETFLLSGTISPSSDFLQYVFGPVLNCSEISYLLTKIDRTQGTRSLSHTGESTCYMLNRCSASREKKRGREEGKERWRREGETNRGKEGGKGEKQRTMRRRKRR